MKIQKQLNQDFSGPGSLLLKLSLLTAVKESYLFLANLYGFLFHPQKTLRKIMADRSQFGLFAASGFGLILFFAFLAFLFYWFFVK